MPAVSVISTVLNEVAEIDALVDSLRSQTLIPTEIIIVDGGSSDGTWERLQAATTRCPGLKPVRDESCSLKGSNGPIARGRNVAIALASSDVIACADAGCTYVSDWLEKSGSSDCRRKCEICARRLLDRSGRPHQLGHRVSALSRNLLGSGSQDEILHRPFHGVSEGSLGAGWRFSGNQLSD